MPEVQVAPVEQAWPHVPQLLASVARLAQPPGHEVSAAVQLTPAPWDPPPEEQAARRAPPASTTERTATRKEGGRIGMAFTSGDLAATADEAA